MAETDLNLVSVITGLEAYIKKTTDFIYNEIGTEIEIPVLKDIKDVNQLYDGYRNTVIGYQKICDSVAVLAQTQIQLRQLRRQLASGSVSVLPTVKSSIKNRIEIALDNIDLCRQSALVLKDKYDARMRFYGSTQYMLSSSRYNEVKY